MVDQNYSIAQNIQANTIPNKNITLSLRWPRDAPNIWCPENCM